MYFSKIFVSHSFYVILDNVFRLRIKMSVSFSKLSIKLQFMLTLYIIFIFLTILRINKNSFNNMNQTIKNEKFNIIAFADIGYLRALNNIKNIVKLDPKLFIAEGDLSYKKSYHHWFNMNLILIIYSI